MRSCIPRARIHPGISVVTGLRCLVALNPSPHGLHTISTPSPNVSLRFIRNFYSHYETRVDGMDEGYLRPIRGNGPGILITAPWVTISTDRNNPALIFVWSKIASNAN